MAAEVAVKVQGLKYVADIAPRIVVNGFPKAGTHLALILVAILAEPWRENDDGPIYHIGTFRFNSWSHDWLEPWNICKMAFAQPEKTWIIGHTGWFHALQRAFEKRGTCMVFIYRDLRDVAVSMLHHIMDGKENLKHSERDLYLAMPDDETRLLAIINGIGHDPGLIKRWERYAPWLDVDWVHSVKFEEIIANHTKAAEDALKYCIIRTAQVNGIPASLKLNDYIQMVDRTVMMLDNPAEYSGTFRKGKAGGWHTYFTPAVLNAFDTAGGNAWLERLGYVV